MNMELPSNINILFTEQVLYETMYNPIKTFLFSNNFSGPHSQIFLIFFIQNFSKNSVEVKTLFSIKKRKKKLNKVFVIIFFLYLQLRLADYNIHDGDNLILIGRVPGGGDTKAKNSEISVQDVCDFVSGSVFYFSTLAFVPFRD